MMTECSPTREWQLGLARQSFKAWDVFVAKAGVARLRSPTAKSETREKRAVVDMMFSVDEGFIPVWSIMLARLELSLTAPFIIPGGDRRRSWA